MSLSWAAPSSNGGSPVTGYDIYRGTSAGGESATPVASNVAATSYTDTGAANGTTYYYTVAAVNAVGVSPQSNEASTTLDPQIAAVIRQQLPQRALRDNRRSNRHDRTDCIRRCVPQAILGIHL